MIESLQYKLAKVDILGRHCQDQAEVDLIYFEMPYEQWQQQNRQCEYAIPNNELERRLTKLKTPTPDEAYRISYYVNYE